MSQFFLEKQRATKIAILTAFFLGLAKISVGVFTYSLAIIASAIDSFFDMFVSFLDFWAIKKSASHPTQNFSFGFGKLEGIVGVFQGFIVASSGLFLGGMGGWKIFNGTEIIHLHSAIFVMIFSGVVTFFLVQFLEKVARKTKSLILEADSAHYKSDLFSNIAILLGILAVYFTKAFWIDGFISVIMSFFIIKSGYEILKKSIFLLLDREIEREERLKIEKVLKEFKKQKKISSYHLLKTRKAGSKIFVNVHVVFDKKILLLKAHKVSDEIEKLIEKSVGESEVLIHLDPYDDSAKKEFC